MPLTFEEKKVVVEQVSQLANESLSIGVTICTGMTVEHITQLRKKARDMSGDQKGIAVKVVPNKIAKIALAKTDYACLEPFLVNQVMLIFSREGLGDAAKLVRDFSKTCEKLQPVAIAVGSQVYLAKEIDKVASLPSRDEALSMLLSVMKAPITKFVRTLAEPHAKFVRTVVAVKDSKSS
jgi:large subunit ribosomal protein L10